MRSGSQAARERDETEAEGLPYDPAEWEARLAEARTRREAVLRDKRAGQGAAGRAPDGPGASRRGVSSPVPFPVPTARSPRKTSADPEPPDPLAWQRRLAEARGLHVPPLEPDTAPRRAPAPAASRPRPVLPATLPLELERAQAAVRAGRIPTRRGAVPALAAALMLAGIAALVTAADPDRRAALEAMPGAALTSARSGWEAATERVGLLWRGTVEGRTGPAPLARGRAPKSLAQPPEIARPVRMSAIAAPASPGFAGGSGPARPANVARPEAPALIEAVPAVAGAARSRAASLPEQRPVARGAAAPVGPVDPRIVLHAPPEIGDAALAEALRDGLSGATMRVVDVPFEVGQTHLRFFHGTDREAAAEIGARFGMPVRSFTEYRPSPAPGLIEVWLAGTPRE